MSAVEVEAISPELVLVCPELREEALAALPDVTWASFVQTARIRAAPAPAEAPARTALRGFAADLGVSLLWALTAVALVIAATLALTLAADALR